MRPVGGSAPGFGAVRYYPVMPTAEICSLPIANLAATNAALFMWTTGALLPDAFRVIDAWGFRYKTVAFVWVKTCGEQGKCAKLLGRWTMSSTEFVLLGTKGSPQREARNVPQLLIEERGRHSAKPAEIRRRIERVMGDVPRVELFAREKAEGWSSWGNEVECDLELAPQGALL
jgi:N6-adenosine-specific RNA methylase IME4